MKKSALMVSIFFLFLAGLFSLYKLVPPEYTKIKSIYLSSSSPIDTYGKTLALSQTNPQAVASFKASKDTKKANGKDYSLNSNEKEKLRLLLEKYKNRSIWALNLKELAREIHTIYPSKKARIKRRLPNKIAVYLEERQPVFLLLTNGGKFFPVSAEGIIGSALQGTQLLDLPIARGDIFKKDKALRLKTVELLKQLPEKEEVFSSENISEITYKPKKGSFILFLIPRYFVLEVKLPFDTSAINNINFVLNYLIQKEEKAALIDASNAQKIIVHRENSSEPLKI